MKAQNPRTLGISMIICRNPKNKKYLVIQETDRSWWIPGGRVDAPQTFKEAGVRECQQEAGVDVQIKGVLRMQHNFYGKFVRLKSILYAQPLDCEQIPKRIADKQSIQGKYMTLEEILALKRQWRDQSIYEWPRYLQEGGKIFPLSLLQESTVQK